MSEKKAALYHVAGAWKLGEPRKDLTLLSVCLYGPLGRWWGLSPYVSEPQRKPFPLENKDSRFYESDSLYFIFLGTT